jgi:hypothetical protein
MTRGIRPIPFAVAAPGCHAAGRRRFRIYVRTRSALYCFGK